MVDWPNHQLSEWALGFLITSHAHALSRISLLLRDLFPAKLCIASSTQALKWASSRSTNLQGSMSDLDVTAEIILDSLESEGKYHVRMHFIQARPDHPVESVFHHHPCLSSSSTNSVAASLSTGVLIATKPSCAWPFTLKVTTTTEIWSQVTRERTKSECKVATWFRSPSPSMKGSSGNAILLIRMTFTETSVQGKIWVSSIAQVDFFSKKSKCPWYIGRTKQFKTVSGSTTFTDWNFQGHQLDAETSHYRPAIFRYVVGHILEYHLELSTSWW